MRDIKIMLILMIILFFIVIFFGVRRYSYYWNYERTGNAMIIQIENYKKLNHKLPNNLSDIPVEEKMEGPYYQKRDSVNYFIYYNLGFDDAGYYYDSKNKKWNYDEFFSNLYFSK